ncbi:MAG TPA: hypothetical protein VLH86_00515 [Patescibacteria group bacterium]|nr:hypothetical protein [Patescibacteria group bacterium]
MSDVEHIRQEVLTGIETIRGTALGTVDSAERRLSDRIQLALDGLGQVSVGGVVDDASRLVSGMSITEGNSKLAHDIFAGVAEESSNPKLEGAVTASGNVNEIATTGLGLATAMHQKAQELAAAVATAKELAADLVGLHAQVDRLVPELFYERGEATNSATAYLGQIA